MAGEPYDYSVESPQAAFQSAYAFGQNIAARQAAQQQAQQQAQLKAQQAAQAKQAMQMVYDNPTPENVSKFYMAYPEYKEQFEVARKPLTDAAKADDLDFSSRALVLLSNGKTDSVDQMLQDRITALKNTPGKEQEAAATEAIAKAIKADPKMGRQIFGMKIAAADPDLYKTVFAQAELTPDEKKYNAIAAKNGPAEAKAWWDAQVVKEKLITVPGIGVFKAEDFGGLGSGDLPRVNTKEERDALPPGSRYIAPNGQVMTKSRGGIAGSRDTGGVGSNTGGSFLPSGY